MKKINAVLSIFATVFLIGHFSFMCSAMLLGWNASLGKIIQGFTHGTAIFITLHALLSLINVLLLHDGTNFSHYQKQNHRTVVQRVSALVMIVLLHVHIKSFGFIHAGAPLSVAAKAGIIIFNVTFFAAIFAHLSVSFSRALITLGLLRSDAAEAKVNRIMQVLEVVFDLVTCGSLIFFIVNWG